MFPRMPALVFSSRARCRCGAGFAYAPSQPGSDERPEAWVCSLLVLGEVELERRATEEEAREGAPGGFILGFAHAGLGKDGKVHDCLPFWSYEVKSEFQPSAGGDTTRTGNLRPVPGAYGSLACWRCSRKFSPDADHAEVGEHARRCPSPLPGPPGPLSE